MNEIFITMARDWLATFKGHMQERKVGSYHPCALVIPPDANAFLLVMEWHSAEEEQIVKEKLATYVREAGAVAVIMFGTAKTFIPSMGAFPVPFLFASIHTPDLPVYTFGQTVTMVDGEPLFGEEFDSKVHNISPWQAPDFWGKNV
jgi:hypothetical protein